MITLANFLTVLLLAPSYGTGGVDAGAASSRYPLQETRSWMRYSAAAEEFSVLLPEAPSIALKSRPYKRLHNDWGSIDKNRVARYQGRVYAAYAEGIVYVIISENNPKHAEKTEVFVKEFEDSLPRHRILGATKLKAQREITGKKFFGRRYLLTFYDGTNGVVDFYVTDQHVYVVEAVGSDESNASVRQFLGSFSLDGKIEQDVHSFGPSPGPETNPENDQIFSIKEVDHKALAVSRPEPDYTDDARRNQVTGTVLLKATFLSSGKVADIEVLEGLKHGLTQKAVEAASKLKFIPAKKNGRFVSQYAELEYNFNLY